MDEYRAELLRDNNWAFKTSWDFGFSIARKELVNVIDIKPDMDILDVGCANGKTLEYIRDNYKVKLYGIEPDRQLASEAGRYGKIFAGTVEKYLKVSRQKFDAIILADVIEHLKEPWITVRELGSRLKDGGAIYASIPNFFNATVVVNLFKYGTFAYHSCDIINKEHLRFFTAMDCMNLFIIAGLVPTILGGIGGVCYEEGVLEDAQLLGNVFKRDDYNFNSYQLVFRATKE